MCVMTQSRPAPKYMSKKLKYFSYLNFKTILFFRIAFGDMRRRNLRRLNEVGKPQAEIYFLRLSRDGSQR